jgi:hypothetical protein
MSKNDHSYWTPQMEVESQREKETHGPDHTLSYREGLTAKMTESEYKKCVDSVYWKSISPATRAFAPYIYDNYKDFENHLEAMGVKKL